MIQEQTNEGVTEGKSRHTTCLWEGSIVAHGLGQETDRRREGEGIFLLLAKPHIPEHTAKQSSWGAACLSFSGQPAPRNTSVTEVNCRKKGTLPSKRVLTPFLLCLVSKYTPLNLTALDWSLLSKKECLSYGGRLLGNSCQFVPDLALMSFILFFGTYSMTLALKKFKFSRYFPTKVSIPCWLVVRAYIQSVLKPALAH